MALPPPRATEERHLHDPQHGENAQPETDPAHLLPAEASPDAAPPASRRSYWLRRILILLVLLLIAGVIVYRIHQDKAATAKQEQKTAAAADRPVPVQTMPVQVKSVPIYLTALGTVTAYNTVTIHSRVDGQLLHVNFTEGQTVNQGQLLLQIDPRPYQAALDQAIGTLAKDQANLRNAEAEAQRYTALYEAGVVSKESQQTQVSTAGQAAGTIKADQAAIEAARVNVGYTRIYAPITGVVGLRQVDPGNIVHASDTAGLVLITQEHPIAIIFTLPEDQLPSVQAAMRGHKLQVIAYDRSDSHKLADGTLLTIDNQIDTTTGTAKLKAVFDNPDRTLFPNQFVNVRLVLNDRANAVVVPTAAIQTGTGGSYVFVVRNGPTPADKRRKPATVTNAEGTAENTPAAPRNGGDEDQPQGNKPQFHVDQVPVKVDLAQGSNSILGAGALQAGDQLIIDGQEKLVDGSAVQPQQARGTSTALGNNANDTVQVNGSMDGSGKSGNTGTQAGTPASPGSKKSSSATSGSSQP